MLIEIIITFFLLVSACCWNPEDDAHPCTVHRFSYAQFRRQFGPQGLPPLYSKPIVILRDTEGDGNAEFRNLTTPENLVQFFGGPEFMVTLSSSNSFSEHRRNISLASYIYDGIQAQETPVEVRANETWYLFGETYSAEWQRLLRRYQLPPCRTCTPEWVALSFGIGNRGSGVQWHVHGPGFSECLHGRKHWVLYPPGHPPKNFHKDQSSRQWMEYVYPQLITAREKPLECTLLPGDLLYFPDQWWHATINLSPYTAFVSTFTTEHGVTMESAKAEL
jgi:hypothetical protein